MANEPPTLSTYEEMADVKFDFAGEDVSREAINQEFEELFTG